MSTTGAIYDIPCMDCSDDYIGESGRLLGTRINEHKRAVRLGSSNASAVAQHVEEQDHSINWEGIKILDREPSKFKRKVKEAIHIRQRRPALNRGGGYDLPPIYNPLIPPIPDSTPETTPGSRDSTSGRQ